jgi:hypothetical protein
MFQTLSQDNKRLKEENARFASDICLFAPLLGENNRLKAENSDLRAALQLVELETYDSSIGRTL